ncbi:MAG: putative DNA-binding domain-containing protein [Bdellovibrionales bacterium]|nr:putative DNA-binding domain-containing protein [Bdellovibrionales bacterium]
METPTLEALQHWLKWAITHPEGAKTAVAAAQFEPKPSCASSVVNAPPLDRFERIDIYGKAFFLRLRDYLLSVFPKSKQLFDRVLQSDAFDMLMAEYIVGVPSTTPNIDTFGLAFPAFCRDNASTKLPNEHSWLFDILELERCVLFAHLSACGESLIKTKLPLLDAETLGSARFTTDPTLNLIGSSANLADLWRSPMEEALPSGGTTFYCGVWRDLSGEVRVQTLSIAAYTCLTALLSGCAVAQISISTQTTQTQIAQWFREWVENGIIRDILLAH